MKQLDESEMKTLVALMRRAIANSQFNIARAVPYAEMGLENDGEFEIDDTHSGNAYNSATWLVDSATSSGEDPVHNEKDELVGWQEYEREEVTLYLDQRALESVAGITTADVA